MHLAQCLVCRSRDDDGDGDNGDDDIAEDYGAPSGASLLGFNFWSHHLLGM